MTASSPILPGATRQVASPPPDAGHLAVDQAELDRLEFEYVPPWEWTRVSIDPADAAFTMAAHHFAIYLDGAIVRNVVTADAVEGLVVTHPAPPPPGHRVPFDDVEQATRRGEVRLRWTGPRGGWTGAEE